LQREEEEEEEEEEEDDEDEDEHLSLHATLREPPACSLTVGRVRVCVCVMNMLDREIRY
jgi:hypothetical protein